MTNRRNPAPQIVVVTSIANQPWQARRARDPGAATGSEVPLRTSLLLLLAACTEIPCDGLDRDNDGICDAASVDWSVDARIEPGTDRSNLYGYDDATLAEVRAEGLEHAFRWPVPITGMLIPYRALDTFFQDPGNNALLGLLERVAGFRDYPGFYDWLGLVPFPDDDAEGIFAVPRPDWAAPGDPMGAALLDTPWGEALSLSCATCHAGSLFGKTVMGLSNRRVRANALFTLSAGLTDQVAPEMFSELVGATALETEMYARNLTLLPSVGTKDPAVIGLDTAVAQVGLSLGRRAADPHASYSLDAAYDPDFAELATTVADVKPPVWWNLRYKTRWSADGLQQSGNPLIYSILANEVGRGTDLVELAAWMDDNRATLDAFTAAIFATPSPRWTDFFGTQGLNLDRAQAGELLFEQHCSTCHGRYLKDWDADDPFATVEVRALPQTLVVDVGTDPTRNEAARVLIDRLNQLAILRDDGTSFAPTEGYTAPPLDGIFARYPYLHNNAVPTLCALLSAPEERPPHFWQGPADDPVTDFDADCVGYPVGEAVPQHWRSDVEAFLDTTRPGLSNAGHDGMLRDAGGDWVLSDGDRADLVMFLKTL